MPDVLQAVATVGDTKLVLLAKREEAPVIYIFTAGDPPTGFRMMTDAEAELVEHPDVDSVIDDLGRQAEAAWPEWSGCNGYVVVPNVAGSPGFPVGEA